MNLDTLISVIIPVYNLENEIERCIISLLGQNYKNLEFVFVDDGSVDRSAEIISEYIQRDARIRLLRQPNQGVTAARINGIKASKGQWIGFVDGDDYIDDYMFDLLLKNAIMYDADISHCGYQQSMNGITKYFYNSGKVLFFDTGQGIKAILEGSIIEPGLWNKLYRRSLFDTLIFNNQMPLNIKINEDLLMNYYLFSQAKKSIFEDQCPYHYIIRAASASRSKINHHRLYDPIKVKEIILESVSEDLKKYAQIAYLRTCVYTYCSIISVRTAECAEARKYCRKILQKNRKLTGVLPKRVKITSFMIRYAPGVFGVLYPLYKKYVQIN